MNFAPISGKQQTDLVMGLLDILPAPYSSCCPRDGDLIVWLVWQWAPRGPLFWGEQPAARVLGCVGIWGVWARSGAVRSGSGVVRAWLGRGSGVIGA